MADAKVQAPVGESQPRQSDGCDTAIQASRRDSLQVAEVSEQASQSKGWGTSVLVVLSSHFVVMNTWGFTNSFGALQSYLTDMFDRPSSSIAWIGSLQIFLLFFIGILSGRLTDAGHFRAVFFLGSLANVVGIFAASFSVQLWSMFLTLGFTVGVGNGCLFCPMLAVMAPNFTSRRGLAIGIAACGSATGGLVYSVIVRQLIPAVGFPWTMRVIALVQLGTLAMANMCLRPHAMLKKYTGWVDWSAFQDARYNYYAVASFLSLFSLYFSFFFIADYSRVAISPPLTYQTSLNLVLVLNGVSVIGRLGSGYAADRLGTLTVYIPVAGATAITLFSWIGVKTVTGTYVWTIVCGIFSGGVQSLFPAGLSSLSTDTSKLGIRIGMVFSIVSVSSLIGPPIGGTLIDAMDGRYLGAQIFAGTSMAMSALFLVAARRAEKRTG